MHIAVERVGLLIEDAARALDAEEEYGVQAAAATFADKVIKSLFDRYLHVLVAEADPVTDGCFLPPKIFAKRKVPRIWEAGREPFMGAPPALL